jgi:hypothetical protein
MKKLLTKDDFSGQLSLKRAFQRANIEKIPPIDFMFIDELPPGVSLLLTPSFANRVKLLF